MRNDGITDESLIRRAAKGDTDAFEELALKYRDKIYAVCLMTVKNREDAADAAQETLIRLYEHIGGFAFKSSFSTWVYAVARNCSLDMLRKKRPEAENAEELLNNIPCEMNVYAAPERAAENAELREELSRQINALPEDMRVVLILRDVKGLSYGEIAEMTGLAEGTIKSRIFRERERLRRLMQPYLKP